MQNGTGAGDRGSELLLSSALLCLVAGLGCGCTITIGGGFTDSEDNGATRAEDAPPLPAPTIWRVPPPKLTPEQQLRQDEVDRFLAEQYSDYKIVEASQGYSGDITYWVDSNSIPGSELEPPPPIWTQEDLTPPPGSP